MNEVLEILKYILPSIVVFLTAYYILKTFLESEHKKFLVEIRLNNQKVITPIRLQAYERVSLFLERISPNGLVMRVHKSGMSSRMFQAELLKTIRSEFEHNLSQQIYISSPVWESIKTAKEETIKIINIASARVKDDASGLDLSKAIFDVMSQLEKVPTQVALENLKREVRQVF